LCNGRFFNHDGREPLVSAPEAFCAEALRVPGCGPKEEVDALVAAVRAPGNEAILGSVRRMVKQICEGSSSPLTKSWGAWIDSEGDAVLSRLRHTYQTLGAACAVIAAIERPDSFGTLTRVGELDEKISALLQKRGGLLRDSNKVGPRKT
jgi:hypothetical protein